MSRRAALRQEAPKAPSQPPESNLTAASLPLTLTPLLALLAGSGCAALIYEIVWFQLLQLVIGSSAVSLGLLLAFYMGGLFLGSAAFSRLVDSRFNPRSVYAMIELGIGAFGILALFGVPLIGHLYVAGPQTGLAGLVYRGFIAGLCLLPPALLMGCTYPAAARWVGGSPSWLGLLYSANTLGAVAGCVLAGFYLLRLYDLGVATYAAAGINVAVALAAFALPGGAAGPAPESRAEAALARARGVNWIYLSIALSGFAALGAEVIWTRLLSLLLGATVYTFSIILAVFLTGLWAGSGAGSLWVKRQPHTGTPQPHVGLAACQILLALACAWTAYVVARHLPYWPVDPRLSLNPWMNFELDLLRCAFAILPAALLWGASFPLALACAAGEGEDPARLTGEVYAANTAGAIFGALLFSLVLIPSAGTSGSQEILIWIAALGAAAAVIPMGLRERAWARVATCCAVALAAALIASAIVPELPWQMIAYGRQIASRLRSDQLGTEGEPQQPLFVGEGISSSVVIAQRGNNAGDRVFYVSGKPEASSETEDMRLQRMMGHVPALIHPHPESALIVGFGAGVTAGSFVPYPEIRKIVICELEPIIPLASGKFFAKQNNDVVHDARTTVIDDDARHYILTSPEKFDVITTDPIHPWVKGTSALYSREYYELVKSHLNSGGVAAQWLPLYESDEDTIRTELKTFFSVFPNATVWSNNIDGNGYDLVLVGRADSSANTPLDVDALDRRLKNAGYEGIAASLAEVGFSSAVDLLASYAGRAADLQPMLQSAQINDDLSMRLQYLAGMGLNSAESTRLYHEILSYRKFPEGLFTGTGARIEALHDRLGRAVRTF